MFIKLILKLSLLMISTHALALVRSESGPGNGTDYVKVLFAQAREEAIHLLEGINANTINYLEMDDIYKEWLKSDVDGSPRYLKLRFYAQQFEFKFQKESCPAENSICFYQDPSPLIVVSLDENQQTTDRQALIMLLHEIGHFTKEWDHLFLDRISSILADSSDEQFVVVTEENRRFVPNLFSSANACEKGEGEQVDNLKMRLETKIFQECLKRKLICENEQMKFSFKAELPQIGAGFDSISTCHGTAVVKGVRTVANDAI